MERFALTNPNDAEPIFHIAEPEQWNPDVESYVPTAFADEGFIHCSIESQLDEVLRKHYPDRNDLTLLTIDPSLITDLVVYEDLYGNGEDFPHIYGPFPTMAVINTITLNK